MTRRPEVAIDCDCRRHRPHGTDHTYHVHRCGCVPCREAHRVHQFDSRKRVAEGFRALVPMEPTRDHIHALRAAGRSIPSIAAEAGYNRQALYLISQGRRKYVRVELAEDIASIPIPPTSEEAP